MADWNAYRRAIKIETLKEASKHVEELFANAKTGSNLDRGQRRACVRLLFKLSNEIVELESQGRQAVYTHFMEEPRDGL